MNQHGEGNTGLEVGQTTIHPLGLALLLMMAFALLLLPRKFAVWPMILIACLIPPAQKLAIFSVNFYFLRIMLLVGTIRILVRREYVGLRLQSIDLVVIAYALCKTTIYTLQWQSFEAFITQAGSSYDSLGQYFFFRCLVRSFDDLHGMMYGFIVAAIPVSVAFYVEHSTGRNVFAFLGGVPLISEIRQGKIRCQGAFSHPITAGCFWAGLIPLVAARWYDRRQSTLLTLIGFTCFLAIILFCGSSTPIMGVVFAVLGGCVYPIRRFLPTMRWGIVVVLVISHFYFPGGAYYLIAKANILGGSTGWFRAYLMERGMYYFTEWMFLGTRDTAHWAAGDLGGVGLADVTNQYLIEGVRGGALTMGLFITAIVLTFKNVTKMMRVQRVIRDRSKAADVWSLGVALFIHVMTCFCLCYFGQLNLLIWMTLSVTASLCDAVKQSEQQDFSLRSPLLVTARH